MSMVATQDSNVKTSSGVDSKSILTRALSNDKLRKVLARKFDDDDIRFYGAILEVDQSSSRRLKKLMALKLISTYVEPGAQRESNALSERTRAKLLKRKGLGKDNFFSEAKEECFQWVFERPEILSFLGKP